MTSSKEIKVIFKGQRDGIYTFTYGKYKFLFKESKTIKAAKVIKGGTYTVILGYTGRSLDYIKGNKYEIEKRGKDIYKTDLKTGESQKI